MMKIVHLTDTPLVAEGLRLYASRIGASADEERAYGLGFDAAAE